MEILDAFGWSDWFLWLIRWNFSFWLRWIQKVGWIWRTTPVPRPLSISWWRDWTRMMVCISSSTSGLNHVMKAFWIDEAMTRLPVGEQKMLLYLLTVSDWLRKMQLIMPATFSQLFERITKIIDKETWDIDEKGEAAADKAKQAYSCSHSVYKYFTLLWQDHKSILCKCRKPLV